MDEELEDYRQALSELHATAIHRLELWWNKKKSHEEEVQDRCSARIPTFLDMGIDDESIREVSRMIESLAIAISTDEDLDFTDINLVPSRAAHTGVTLEDVTLQVDHLLNLVGALDEWRLQQTVELAPLEDPEN